MKCFVALIALSGVYIFAFRGSPTALKESALKQAAAGPVAQPAPTTSARNFVKRPLDRTHAVLDQVRTQRDANAF